MPLLDLESIRFRRLGLWSGKGSAFKGCRDLYEVVEAVSEARWRARPNGTDHGHYLRVPDDAFSFASINEVSELGIYLFIGIFSD